MENLGNATTKSINQQKRFVVKTKGYNETFDSASKAKDQFDILKKRAIKAQEPIKIQIYEKDKSVLKEIDSVSITEDFYGD